MCIILVFLLKTKQRFMAEQKRIFKIYCSLMFSINMKKQGIAKGVQYFKQAIMAR